MEEIIVANDTSQKKLNDLQLSYPKPVLPQESDDIIGYFTIKTPTQLNSHSLSLPPQSHITSSAQNSLTKSLHFPDQRAVDHRRSGELSGSTKGTQAATVSQHHTKN